jgi:hypothetical protein
MPIPTNMRPAGRSIQGASRAIGTVAATVAAAEADEQVEILANFTGRIGLPGKTFTTSDAFDFPGVSSAYLTASAFTMVAVYAPSSFGNSDNPAAGDSRWALSAGLWANLGTGASKLVANIYSDSYVGFASDNTVSLSTKYATILRLGGGTLSATFSGDGGTIKTTSAGDVGSLTAAMSIGGYGYANLEFAGVVYDGLLFNAAKSIEDLMSLISQEHGIVW